MTTTIQQKIWLKKILEYERKSVENWIVVFEKEKRNQTWGENLMNKINEKSPIIMNESVLVCQFKLPVVVVIINSQMLTDCNYAQKQ